MKLTETLLREKTDEATWQRGVAYYKDGQVQNVVEDGDTLIATVEGRDVYRVRFTLLDDHLLASCTCPIGRRGVFCKHCVAVGLARIAEDPGGSSTKADDALAGLDQFSRDIDRIRQHLTGMDRSALVKQIVEQAMEDDQLLERLKIEVLTGAAQVDRKALRLAITAATRVRGFVHYREARRFAQGIVQVVHGLAGLLERGFAEDVIPLAEYALHRVERAIGHMDDSDGHMRPILNDLQTLHHAACVTAKPNPVKLARRIFEWETTGEWEVFLGAAKTYADVFGNAGLGEYRRLAEAAWAEIPYLGPGDDRRSYESNRFRITHTMEALAVQSGDLDALIEVKRHDLSSAYRFLEIATICQQAGRVEQALDWAEQGLAAFPDRTDPRLFRFLADAYRRNGREDDALRIVWRNFVDRPEDLESYQRLKTQAERMGVWPTWRERALNQLCAGRRGGKDPRHCGEWTAGAVSWRSSLVAVFLWENDPDAAWQEACSAGCSITQWRALARCREADHPDDAVRIYQDYVAYLVNQTNNAACAEAAEIVATVRNLLRTAADEGRFSDYLAELRQRFSAKRNFMRLLEGL